MQYTGFRTVARRAALSSSEDKGFLGEGVVGVAEANIDNRAKRQRNDTMNDRMVVEFCVESWPFEP